MTCPKLHSIHRRRLHRSRVRGFRWQHRSLAPRRGAAAVELAVSLPLIVLIAFGAMEGSNKIFIRQAAVQAAYEAAKGAKKPNGTSTRGEALARQVLAARNINTPQIEFQPANVETLDAGDIFSVTVRVPGSARTVTGIGPFNSITIEAKATMVKE